MPSSNTTTTTAKRRRPPGKAKRQAAALVPVAPARTAKPSQHPAAVYLAGLAEGPGRVSMLSTLRVVAGILGNGDVETTPWAELRFSHVAALRSKLAETYAPATCNKALAAVRGTLKAAWRLGLMDGEDYRRVADVGNVKGSRLPAGRALDGGELRALFAACADSTPAGARDAAAFSLMFGAGLRRAEAAAVQVADYDAETGALRVLGKGNKERTCYLANGGKSAVDGWLAVRGQAEGSLLCPVSQSGQVSAGAGITAQALMVRLGRRCRQAGVAAASPHDLRRSFVSGLLDAGADIASVQKLAGHASPATTARYDRRPEAAKLRAASMLHVPYVAGAVGPARREV